MTQYPVPDVLQPYMPMIVGMVTALLILGIGWLLSRWVRRLLYSWLTKHNVSESLTPFISSFAQYLVLGTMILVSLDKVGIETTSLVALLGTVGLTIGLGLQGNLTHFASGITLLVFRPFSVGDRIQVGSDDGVVQEIGLFATRLTTVDNYAVSIPNGVIVKGSITNKTVGGHVRAMVVVRVPYGTDAGRVIALLVEGAKKSSVVLDDPRPIAGLWTLGSDSLEFAVAAWSNHSDYIRMRIEVNKHVYETLQAAGIEFAFSQIVVHEATPTPTTAAAA